MKQFRQIARLTGWALSVVGLIVCLAASDMETEKILCQEIKIQVDHNSGNAFVTDADVMTMLMSKGDSLIGSQLINIPIATYERLITNHPSIKKAEVYTQLNGTLAVSVQQRQPILRVITANNESFYIDEEGFVMPTSTNYTARVPIASGNITDDLYRIRTASFAAPSDSLAATTKLDDLYKLTMFLRQDEFWNAQIQQLHLDENNEILMIPRVGKHKILLGDVKNLEARFNKLWIFYQKGLNRAGWDQYHTINLKYKDQVICSK